MRLPIRSIIAPVAVLLGTVTASGLHDIRDVSASKSNRTSNSETRNSASKRFREITANTRHAADNRLEFCCGSLYAAAQPIESTVAAPLLEAADLLKLRLPDVRIVSVERRNNGMADDIARGAAMFAGASATAEISVPHVKVHGVIGGTIHFELLLPDEWNGRFLMGGGGGYVGSVINLARFSVNSGYATVGTDTGHQWNSVAKAGWALDNLEAQVNFGYVAVHRTSEVAKAIIRDYYHSDPSFSYFMGCSRGGGQAMMEAQRYPEDFDGIVSAAPALDWTGFSAAMVQYSQHFFPDPNQLTKSLVSPDDLRGIHQEVLKQCDSHDGVEDGILDDPRDCAFDLSRVAGLTVAQRKAIQAVYDGPHNEHGRIHPGIPLGAEGEPAGWFSWISGSIPSFLAQEEAPNPGFAIGTEFYKYFMFNNPNWDYTQYDFSTWQRDTHLAGTLLNATNPDLGRFKARNGKLILWHGWGDCALTPLASIEYYEQVEKLDPNLRDYFRLYLLPGVMHCQGGPGPDKVDWLSAIVEWVEHGKAPERLIASKSDLQGNIVMTRPLYPYPKRAAYKGSGSTNDAENFTLMEP